MELNSLTITIITGVISSVLGAIVYAKYTEIMGTDYFNCVIYPESTI